MNVHRYLACRGVSAVSVLLLIVLLAACASADIEPLEPPKILVEAGGESAAELAGANLSGVVTIVVEAAAGTMAELYLDAEPSDGVPILFAAASSTRLELDTRALENGPHFIAVRLTRLKADQVDEAVSVEEFTVRNDQIVANEPPTVYVGPDLTAVVGEPLSLEATVGDDGLPTGSIGLQWEAMSAPGQVVFADSRAATTTATFKVEGTYVLRLTVSDGSLHAQDAMTVNVSPAPDQPEPTEPDPDPNPEPDPDPDPNQDPDPVGPTPAYDHLEQLYVATDGNDSSSGTAQEPLRTINEGLRRALANRSRGIGTRVLVMPGTYRESLVGGYSSAPGPLIVLESYQRHRAVITGADRWTGWTCSADVCTHTWQFDWGTTPNPWPGSIDIGELALRRELISVNGNNLDQVLSRSGMPAGSFYVDEGADLVYVKPPSGVDLNSARVEVGVRPVLLRTQGLSNLVVEGFVFTHAATQFRGAAVDVVDQSDVVANNLIVQLNGQNGVSLKGRRITLSNSEISESGSSGLTAYRLLDSSVSNVSAVDGNWRGVRGGYDSWEVGNKFTQTHRIVIEDFASTDNMSRGLWLDSDNADIVIEDATLCRNLRDGLFIEANQGPITVSGSTICDNNDYGILTSASQDLTITDNVIEGNVKSQLRLSGSFGHSLNDFETGEHHELENVDWNVSRNTVASDSGGPLITTTYPTSAWPLLMQTSVFDYNSYTSHVQRPFQIAGGTFVDFGGWKSNTGQDGHSSIGQ